MRMKNRFQRMGKSLLGAMCLLSVGSLTYSCSDDYDLDETMPKELGGSIYSELKARNYTTVVRLIEDLGYKDVLSKTGSKTLFAANDSAYQKFFQTSGWMGNDNVPVTSYEQLTTAQKKLLLNSCMLNNAYVLEMLANTEGGGKNLCLRQASSASILDSVRYWKWNELPDNENVGEVDAEGNSSGDKRFWDEYRQQSRRGIYMVMDKTTPMMTHFLEGQMKEKKIKHSDVGFIVGDPNWSETENRSYIYDSRILEQDIVCLNGYIHTVDKVILTPQNMAEMIRQNGEQYSSNASDEVKRTSTKLFSTLLERFSAPYYDYDLTDEYRKLFDIGTDSVFQKLYISDRSQMGKITTGPDKKSLGVYASLTYDPGWNQYAISSTTTKENDMAAMFVPNDFVMEEYFLTGGGQVLMNRYATRENTRENLIYNISQIPLDIVQPLLNNLMKDSFNESVPSKYKTIMNDAQDQMFDVNQEWYSSEDKFKERIQKVMLANNGVVYVMDKVSTPADYAAVLAPALYNTNTQVVKSVVRADDSFIEGSSYQNAPLKKYYSTYLKAMQSRFSFFVPTDDGLKTYGLVDPMTIASGNNFKYWRFEYNNPSGALIPIRGDAYNYDPAVGQSEGDLKAVAGGTAANKSEANASLGSGSGLVKKTLLIDMIDQHIIVHNQGDVLGVNADAKYYISRSGAPVVVETNGDPLQNGVGMIIKGGLQTQIASQYGREEFATVVESYDMTAEKNGYGNGMTYLIDRPIQPAARSLYNVLYRDPDHYSAFYNLCMSSFSEEQLKIVGLKKADMTAADWKAEQAKYRIFTNTGVNPANQEQLVRFFNNYRYTVYVPTNEAMKTAYDNGLPTYEQISDYIEANKIPDPENEGEYTMSADHQAKALAMINMLVNFGKYHFQDESLYLDNVEKSGKYQTSCIDTDKETGNEVYIELNVNQRPGSIQVTDNDGNTVSVVAPYNVMARDANYHKEAASYTGIDNSSYVVVHQINGVLNFAPLNGARYDAVWATAGKARAFVKKYGIKK